MSMPCCNIANNQYFNTQGKVDVNKIKEIFGKSAEVEKREEDQPSPFVKSGIAKVTVYKVLVGDTASNLCKCPCHRHNACIDH